MKTLEINVVGSNSIIGAIIKHMGTEPQDDVRVVYNKNVTSVEEEAKKAEEMFGIQVSAEKKNETHIPQLNIENPDDGQVSRPIPMASAAGWYQGRVCWNEDRNGWLPHSRCSTYFPSREHVLEMMRHDDLDIDDLAEEHGNSISALDEAYVELSSHGLNHERVMEEIDRLAFNQSDEELLHEIDCFLAETGMDREIA